MTTDCLHYVFTTSTVPAASGGEVAVIEVSELTVKDAAGTPPNVTAKAPVKPLPLIVTEVPPAVVPLVVPITLFQHYVRKFEIDYLRKQIYLEPHPKELMLRNHV